ncbi:MAG: tetratricopeptide repeat protein [Planctomycetes bacterium]|nr:tetratricopeptide repeat protein [Planctomycetota bacterium]
MKNTAPECSAPPAGRVARWLLGPWLAALLGLLVYVHSVGGEFVYDDVAIVRDNPRVRDWTDFRAIWLRDWWYSHGQQMGGLIRPERDRLYRPLTLFTFALNYAVGGGHPFGYHGVNVLLHGAACWLVWLVAFRLFGRERLAAIAGAVFALHPIHVEAVAGIVGRAEILSTVLMLLGMLAVLPREGLPTRGRYLLAALAMFAALLAKENALCLPAVAALAVWHRARAAGATWKCVQSSAMVGLAAVILAGGVYFSMRYVALENRLVRTSQPGNIFNPLSEASGWKRWLPTLDILGHYARLTLAPASLSCDYGLSIIDPDAGATALTLVGAIAVVGIGFALRRPERPAGMLAAMFVASYLLISNTLVLVGVTVAERLFYWPSVIVAIGVGLGVEEAFRFRPADAGYASRVRIIRLLGLALLAALGLRTIVRVPDWQTTRTLFAVDHAAWPAGIHLATEHARFQIHEAERMSPANQREALLAESRTFLDESLRKAPRYPAAMRLRGIVAALTGHTEEAVRFFEVTVTLAPEDNVAQLWLAELRGSAAVAAERIAALEKRLADDPSDVSAHLDLGAAYLEIGRNVDGLRQYETAAKLAPQNVDALRGYGQALAVNLQNEQAAEVFRKLLLIDPNDWMAHGNLATVLNGIDPAQALAHARRAFQIEPNDLRTQMNLAAALAVNHRTKEAIDMYNDILTRLPADDPRREMIEGRLRELRKQ